MFTVNQLENRVFAGWKRQSQEFVASLPSSGQLKKIQKYNVQQRWNGLKMQS